MGYGPGHARMVDYFDDYVDAPGTNGVADVGVLHPGEIAGDLARIGFTHAAYALTPTGPGDTHGAWIFVRAMKPGPDTALIERREWLGRVRPSPDRHGSGAPASLRWISRDRDAAQAAVTFARGLSRDVRDLPRSLGEMTRDRSNANARTSRIRWRWHEPIATAGANAPRTRPAERDQLRRQADVQGRQLVRLRVADRRRMKAVIDDAVEPAADWRVGVLGTGEHTEWLLQDTSLGDLAAPVLFRQRSIPCRSHHRGSIDSARARHSGAAARRRGSVVTRVSRRDGQSFSKRCPSRACALFVAIRNPCEAIRRLSCRPCRPVPCA